MIQLAALWTVLIAMVILLVILREDYLIRQGKVPIGRLRRLWFKSERRSAPRYQLDWPVRYIRSVTELPVQSQMRNLSQTGMGLLVQENLRVGTSLQLEIMVPTQGLPIKLSGQVVWAKEIRLGPDAKGGTRVFFIGIRFFAISPQVEATIKRALMGPPRPDRPSVKEDAAPQYARLKRRLWLLDLFLTTALAAGLLVSHLSHALRDWVVGRFLGWPLQVALYLGILGAFSALIFFPLDWYRSFQLEHRFELSGQRLSQWGVEHAKKLAVGGLLGLILIEGLYLLLHTFPKNWWAWAAVAWTGWSIGMTRLLPTLLIPIFYRQRPLQDEPLKERLQQFLERMRAGVHGIFEIDLSRTTRKANACLCGMGKTRRVLISDTLLSAYPTEEIEVVLAHEIGHHRMKHLWISIGISAAAALISCFAVDRIVLAARTLFQLQGLTDLAALPLLALGFLWVNLLFMPMVNGFSRHLERQADRFALTQTGNPGAFIATLQRLAKQNLAEPAPPAWVEFLFYDHPPIAKRIALAQNLMNDRKVRP